MNEARRRNDLISRIAAEIEFTQLPADSQIERPYVDPAQQDSECRIVHFKVDRRLRDLPKDDRRNAQIIGNRALTLL